MHTGMNVETLCWLEKPSSATLRRAGRISLELLTNSDRWIHRRVERIRLTDHKTAHHQISVDFSLPVGLPPVGRIGGDDNKKSLEIFLAPMFLVEKRGRSLRTLDEKRPIQLAPYSNIDVSDHSGNRLAFNTWKHGADIAAQVLIIRARQLVTNFDNDHRLVSMVGKVALADDRENMSALHYLLRADACHGDKRHDLREDPTFCELAYALATHTLVPCWFFGRPEPRSIVKLSYDQERVKSPLSLEETGRQFLGLKSELCHVKLNEIGASASYHVEVEVPKELYLNEIGLIGERYEYGWQGRRPRPRIKRLLNAIRHNKPPPRDEYNYYVRQSDRTDRGHIYIPEPDGRRVGAVWVKLRTRPQGFLTGSLLAALVTAVVLTFVWRKSHSIAESDLSASAIALLLLIPSFLAGYIARPGEHALASRMLRSTRVALIANAALPFAAALHLLTVSKYDPVRDKTLAGTWMWLAISSYVFVVWFAICNYVPRPHGRSRYFIGRRPPGV